VALPWVGRARAGDDTQLVDVRVGDGDGDGESERSRGRGGGGEGDSFFIPNH